MSDRRYLLEIVSATPQTHITCTSLWNFLEEFIWISCHNIDDSVLINCEKCLCSLCLKVNWAEHWHGKVRNSSSVLKTFNTYLLCLEEKGVRSFKGVPERSLWKICCRAPPVGFSELTLQSQKSFSVKGTLCVNNVNKICICCCFKPITLVFLRLVNWCFPWHTA